VGESHQIIFYFNLNEKFFMGKLEIDKNLKSYFINAFDFSYGWQSFLFNINSF
jgi:hypothetical protein